MENPETTTPSVERLEAIARLVAPDAWSAIDTGRKWNVEDDARRREASLAKARQIAALPCKGGEDEDQPEFPPELWGWLGERDLQPDIAHDGSVEWADVINALDDHEAALLIATPTPDPDTGRGLREALGHLQDALRWIDAVPSEVVAVLPAMPGFDRDHVDTFVYRSRQALAALSDTPRGREGEGKQGLMASRDLGPTTVASSLKGSDVGEVGEGRF